MNGEEQVQRFLDYLRVEKRYSANTINAYARDLEKLRKYLNVPLERVRSHFEEDWDACRDYARQHNPVVTRTQ